MRELADEYVVLVDLPGVKTQDVNVELTNRLQTNSGAPLPFEAGDAQLVERP